MTDRPTPPCPEQPQEIPGRTDAMDPRPDHGETSYKGSGKLAGKATIVTGGDSGIGRGPGGSTCRSTIPVTGG